MNLKQIIDDALSTGEQVGSEVLTASVQAFGSSTAGQHFYDLIVAHVEMSAFVKTLLARLDADENAIVALQQAVMPKAPVAPTPAPVAEPIATPAPAKPTVEELQAQIAALQAEAAAQAAPASPAAPAPIASPPFSAPATGTAQ